MLKKSSWSDQRLLFYDKFKLELAAKVARRLLVAVTTFHACHYVIGVRRRRYASIECNITRQSATYHYFFTKKSIYFSKVCKKYVKKTIAYFCVILSNWKKYILVDSCLRCKMLTNNMNIEAFLAILKRNKCTHHVPG